jgi:hypothetical protein
VLSPAYRTDCRVLGTALLLFLLTAAAAHARGFALNRPIPAGWLADGTLATVRAHPQYSDIRYQDQTISSSDDALQTAVRQRMAGGLTMQVLRTLGKSIVSESNTAGDLSNVLTTGAPKAPQGIYNMGQGAGCRMSTAGINSAGRLPATCRSAPGGAGRWAPGRSLRRW